MRSDDTDSELNVHCGAWRARPALLAPWDGLEVSQSLTAPKIAPERG